MKSRGEENYQRRLRLIGRLTENAVCRAIADLPIKPGSVGLDAGCGIGISTAELAKAVRPGGRVVGLDFSEAMLAEARAFTTGSGAIEFQPGDFLNLPFDEGTFDWLWCKDSLWPGVITNDPASAVKGFARVVRPGGTIILVYWSSQVLLPGYPELEARLMKAFAETTPYLHGISPANHFLRAGGWLKEIGLTGVRADSYAASLSGPLNEAQQESALAAIWMFFENLRSFVSGSDWELLERIARTDSNEDIVRREDYFCLITYSVFSGQVPV